MKQKMKCLVTGAAGGIGSNLCRKLMKLGHDVIGLDDWSVGTNEPGCEILAHDIAGNQHLHDYPFDWIFHLAARADIVPSIRNPRLYHEVNVTGTLAMLEYAKRIKAKRFIYAASASCYGANPPIPATETSPTMPAYPYALTKWLGERWALHYGQVYKVPVISLRLFNVYGPGLRTANYGAMFGVFLAQRANGMPLTVIGDGTQERDFIHVHDVCDAFVRAAKSDELGECFNICSGVATSVRSVARLIGGPTINIPRRPGEPECIVGANLKAFSRLGWKPTTSLSSGIRGLLDNLKAYRDAPVWTPDSIAEQTKEWTACLGS